MEKKENPDLKASKAMRTYHFRAREGDQKQTGFNEARPTRTERGPIKKASRTYNVNMIPSVINNTGLSKESQLKRQEFHRQNNIIITGNLKNLNRKLVGTTVRYQ